MLCPQKTQHGCKYQSMLPQRSSIFQRRAIQDLPSGETTNFKDEPSIDSYFHHEYSQVPIHNQDLGVMVSQKMDQGLFKKNKEWNPNKKKGKDRNNQKKEVISSEKPKINKKRTLSEEQAKHIFLGEEIVETSKKSKQKVVGVTGYHSKVEGNKSVAEGYGPVTKKAMDCYIQSVRHREATDVTKKNDSTFYPDTWTREDIVQAIEYASGNGNFLEVTIPTKGQGMTLYNNKASYFPYFE